MTGQKEYPITKVLIPTYQALIMGCTKCDSRDIRTFPDVVFNPENFPQEESSILHIQAQCNSCGHFFIASPRQYLIDTEGTDKDGSYVAHAMFVGVSVSVGGDSTLDDDFDEDDEEMEEDIENDWYPCDYCEEEFANDRARIKHQKDCPERPVEEERKRRPIIIPDSTEVNQDKSLIDKSILYTSSDTTLVQLIAEGGMSIYRKDFTSCPRVEYIDGESVPCDHEEYDKDDWLQPPLLKEVCFAISDSDTLAPMKTPQEELVICVSECPTCGKKSILHEFIGAMLNYDFIDHQKIMDEIVLRGLMDNHVKEKIVTEKDLEERINLEAQRLGVGDVFSQSAEDIKSARAKMIPDFRLKCHHQKCDAEWTKKNSNPMWMTTEHLVARCPKCNSQRPINKELEELGIL